MIIIKITLTRNKTKLGVVIEKKKYTVIIYQTEYNVFKERWKKIYFVVEHSIGNNNCGRNQDCCPFIIEGI